MRLVKEGERWIAMELLSGTHGVNCEDFFI